MPGLEGSRDQVQGFGELPFELKESPLLLSIQVQKGETGRDRDPADLRRYVHMHDAQRREGAEGQQRGQRQKDAHRGACIRLLQQALERPEPRHLREDVVQPRHFA